MRRILFLLFSLAGLGLLLGLGTWQVQRLFWKQGILATIEARIAADPVPLTAEPFSDAGKYKPVTVTGTIHPQALRVLVSRKGAGAGYRIISPFETDMGRILLDRGFAPLNREAPAGHAAPVTITGNLHWPEETDSFTPEPDLNENIWFARDVALMARRLDTRPLLVVLRDRTFDDGPVIPMPVDTASIPNDHLQYAITWFSLALIWAVMSLFFLRRSRTKPES